MVNIFLFEKALKLSWIPKILLHTDTPWYCLLVETVGNLNKLSYMGTKWCIALLKKCNPFWKSTFAIWSESSGLKHIKSNFDIHNSTLWFNEHISKESLFFPKWAKHGISIVGDVITSDGVLLSREQIAQTYNFNVNILEYCDDPTDRVNNNLTVRRTTKCCYKALLLLLFQILKFQIYVYIKRVVLPYFYSKTCLW